MDKTGVSVQRSTASNFACAQRVHTPLPRHGVSSVGPPRRSTPGSGTMWEAIGGLTKRQVRYPHEVTHWPQRQIIPVLEQLRWMEGGQKQTPRRQRL